MRAFAFNVPAAMVRETATPPAGIINKMVGKLTQSRRLSEEDAARYAHIFAFQDVGEMDNADAEIAKLTDQRLMGHVLYQRYMGPYYKTSFAELRDWMKQYADHPQAQRIYDLAQKRKADDNSDLRSPQAQRGVLGQQDFDVGQLAQPYMKSRKLSAREKEIVRSIRRNLAERPTAALRILETEEVTSLFNATEYDALQAEIAESYFFNQKPEQALSLASASVARSGKDIPKAGWIGGLAAWEAADYAAAAKYFESAAVSKRASVWMTSAAAHWAARSHLRAGSPQEVSKWLARSAAHPRTFYGIISMKMLGRETEGFNWDMPAFSDRHARRLSSHPAGRRAIALIAAERADLAELEISRLHPGSDRDLQEAMIALANEAGMPWVSLRMGSSFVDDDGRLYDAALYPEAPWRPDGGFEVDKALVYAFIRQESKFDPSAHNRSSGATGLMQLMPMTANHVARQQGEKVDKSKLSDPVLNIDLGQKYLAELLEHPGIDNNLFKLAVAYNAGPGKLARWSKTVTFEDDPLFFIEAIPAAETRMFVERVLANYWIYRMKFGQDTDSLDRVAEGRWPTYVAQDIRRSTRFADAMTLLAR